MVGKSSAPKRTRRTLLIERCLHNRLSRFVTTLDTFVRQPHRKTLEDPL
jgi:hypothetical protein